jgi:hypothetical protein
LLRLNEGRHRSDGSHSSREAARDKKRITQSFCSALPVTPYQQREAVSVIGQLNLDRFGSQKRLEKVVLGVIEFVVDRDRHQYFLGDQEPSAVDWDAFEPADYPTQLCDQESFSELCERHGVADEDRYSVSQLIKRELKRIGYFQRAESTRE